MSNIIPVETPKRKFSLASPTQNKFGWKDSYRDQDSCLHYFISTTQSEKILDNYISQIIRNFLQEPGPIHAQIPNTLLTTQMPKNAASSEDLEHYLYNLKTNIVDKATKTGAPTMIGHMTTALPYFHRPLSRLLTALNQNVVKVETASTFTNLERQSVAMLHTIFYKCPSLFYSQHAFNYEHSLGIVCSGGTIANITAMWIARNKALGPTNTFGGIAKHGFLTAMQHHGYTRAVIVGSRLMHYSFKKAADLLGIGEDGLVLIPTDENMSMRIDALVETMDALRQQKTLVIAVVGICGTTEAGSIDPLNAIALVCKEHGVHFHVDAAWGGPLIFSADHNYKLNGISIADSITVDGHKQLYTPMGLGVLLLKNPTLATFIRKTANYVIRQDSPDLGKFTLEGSRPANTLYLHASLSLLGQDGLSVLITRSCTLVRQLYLRLLLHPSQCFQPLHEPQSNLLLYRYVPKELRHKFIQKQLDLQDDKRLNDYVVRIQTKQADSHFFVSRTKVDLGNGYIDCFRVVIANPLTQWEDIEDNLNDQIRIAQIVEDEVQQVEKERQLLDSYGLDHFWPGWPFDM
ncbi:pyridoxal phosphate-dependent transferase [Gorgonomyces haynaldii]|nr:pyridoxal phosphate-dependent transferase [Gorgonomyces haynaldii]